MSNFLHRIAAAVAPPAEAGRGKARLQPTMGSVFMRGDLDLSGTTPREPARTEIGEDVVPSSSHLQEVSVPLFRSPRFSDAPARRAEYTHERTQAVPSDFEHEQPLLPLGNYVESLVRASLQGMQHAKAAIGDEAKDASHEAILPITGSSQPVATGPETARAERAPLRTIQPLVIPPQIAKQGQRREQLERLKSGRAGDDRGDDVHISIGRIEVAAIAPGPLVRVPAQERRKSMSLDEYLRKFGSGGRV
jgi:hypothetical protein